MPSALFDAIDRAILDTRGVPTGGAIVAADSSLAAHLPEITLIGTILAMLVMRMLPATERVSSIWPATLGVGLALVQAIVPAVKLVLWPAADVNAPETVVRLETFTGLLVMDSFTVGMRLILITSLILVMILTKTADVASEGELTDVLCLFLGATVGMCLMVAANHLIMIFLSVEMASVPVYVLAGMRRMGRTGAEAALKFAIYGAGSAGIMLYGLGLIGGLLGTGHLPTLADLIAEQLATGNFGQQVFVLVLAGLMVTVGLAFKLSAFPFHFWCPDVFAGSPSEVGAFLSVTSKAAALALLVRLSLGIAAPVPETFFAGERSAVVQLPVISETATDRRPLPPSPRTLPRPGDSPRDRPSAPDTSSTAPTQAESILAAARDEYRSREQRLFFVRDFLAKLITMLAVVTCTFGNLVALAQTRLKRLLAYSTIAHAGYLMMPVPAILAQIGLSPEGCRDAAAAIWIYLAIYLFMNLGLFGLVISLRRYVPDDTLTHYSGLIRTRPATVVCTCLIVLGLMGLPPLAGFVAKFAVFASLAEGYQTTVAAGREGGYLLALLIVGLINTVLSLFYYLRLIRVLVFDPKPHPPADERGHDAERVAWPVYLGGAVMLILFLLWEPLWRIAHASATHLVAG